MRKTPLALCLALTLGGCVASLPNPVSKTNLAELESAYGVALSIAVGYRSACASKAIPPSCRPIVTTLQGYDRKAHSAIVAARNFVKNNPTIDAVAYLTAAASAVADFQQAESKYGVK